MERILRVNLSEQRVQAEPLPEAYANLGGRALTSRIVCDEVDPGCDPLGLNNKLVFAPGLLSGTVLSSSSRLSVGCKSPLTGGIKEANAGGQSGLKMAMLGYRALILEGALPETGWWLLIVGRDGATFAPADDLAGLLTPEVAAHLFERYGKGVGLSLIGPAGQMQMNIAGICNTDPEGRPSRLNARGGVGAAMGAKRLLGIVWDEPGYLPVRAPDAQGWKEGARLYNRELSTQPATAERFPKYGTASTLEVVNRLGGLPIRGFRAGQEEKADLLSGLRMHDLIKERGGHTTHSCMTGCAIRCSNVWVDTEGREVASSMEFETNGLFGSNLDIWDFDAIAGFTRWCNDLGVDTIETGGAVSVLMEAGLIAWGDAAGVQQAFSEIHLGTPLGRLIGLGAGLAGRALGVRRVPVVKNQTISAYDPRVIKGNGVTYCTTAMGADHTAGNTIGAKTDHLDPSDKIAISREMQIASAVLDALGFCNFARGAYAARPEAITQLFEARFGRPFTLEELRRLGRDINLWELSFNDRAGLPRVESLPEWMQAEKLPPHDASFDVPRALMEKMWDEV